MAADANLAACAQDCRRALRSLRIDILVRPDPQGSRCFVIDDIVRDKAAHLGIFVHTGSLPVVVLGPWSPVPADDIGRSVIDPGLRYQIGDVRIQGVQWKLVLGSPETIDCVR